MMSRTLLFYLLCFSSCIFFNFSGVTSFPSGSMTLVFSICCLKPFLNSSNKYSVSFNDTYYLNKKKKKNKHNQIVTLILQ